MAAKQPWRKWYPQDWRADAPLRMCSYAARGLWADLLTLMHESNEVGFLLVEGVAPTPRQLVGLLGGTEKEITKLLAELAAAKVFSVVGGKMPDDVKALIPDDIEDGVILSRRMVRDEAKATKDRENGKGGGNPRLKGGDNPKANRGVNPPANPQSQSQSQSPEARNQKDHEAAAASSSVAACATEPDPPVAVEPDAASGPEPPGKPATPTDDAGPIPVFLDRSPDIALRHWQETARAEGWPAADFLNSTRRHRLLAILAVCGGLEGWRAALEHARDAEFLRTPDGTPQRWFDLDWLLDESHFTRLMEGRYAERRNPQGRAADSGSPTVADGVAAAFARRYAQPG